VLLSRQVGKLDCALQEGIDFNLIVWKQLAGRGGYFVFTELGLAKE